MSMHLKPMTPEEESGLRAHGLPVGTPSQLADAFRLGMAWADKARAEAALAEPQPDADGAWKASVIDQLIIAHILTAEHENDPLKAIQDLLAYHADIAVDPRVSGAAAKLMEQAKAEEREACALVCESRESRVTGSVAILRGAASAILARGQG